MNKIPVGKTISYAYNFAFGSLGTIIGLVWLPLVILTVLNFLQGTAGGGVDVETQSAVTRLSQGVGSLAVMLLSVLLYAIVYVAVTRQALGMRQGTATVHFSLGMPEFRLFGAMLLSFAISFVLLVTYLLGTSQLPPTTSPLIEGAEDVVALLGGLALIYALVRLWFLLVPVNVIEEQVSIRRGWALARGNFWQILAVLLAVTLPILAILAIAEFALMAKDLYAIPASLAKNETLYLQRMFEILQRHTPELIFVQLLLAPFYLGLTLGASAFAYRAIVQGSPNSIAA